MDEARILTLPQEPRDSVARSSKPMSSSACSSPWLPRPRFRMQTPTRPTLGALTAPSR